MAIPVVEMRHVTKYFAKAISSDEVCERLKNGVF